MENKEHGCVYEPAAIADQVPLGDSECSLYKELRERTMEKMKILFISDYVCPYCLVAKEVLKAALEETGLQAEITWQPHELTVEPAPRVDTYHDAVRKARYQVLIQPCKELGLDMKLPPKVVPRPYTRLAFEGWYYACEHGKGEEYNDLMYRAYFLEEQNIGEVDVLAALAERIGLDGADFRHSLETGAYSAAEKAAVSYTREVLKPSGVPTIYMDGEKISLREYTVEEMTDLLLDQARKSAGDGVCCGADGCH